MKDVSILEKALEEIENDEGQVCQRCEGNGKLWADGKPHLPSYNGALINCGECGGSGQIHQDLKEIATAALAAYHSSDKGEDEGEYNPYWYWPQCDVEGCEGVSCNGGGCWRETGYWQVCPEHSKMFREGKPQPKMKQSSIDKEATRDKVTGYLPSPQNTNP